MNEVLSLLGALTAILLVLAGASLFTRWAAKGGLLSPLGAASGSGRLQVLDRVGLGKDQFLLVVRAGERYFLLGSSPAGLTVLRELAPEEGIAWSSPSSLDVSSQRPTPEFGALLRRLRNKDESVEKR